MEKDLDLDNTAIQNLADQINDAISGVTNVEQILGDTSDDLRRAEGLKTDAERIRDNAKTQLDTANNITEDLGKALEAQNDADQKIQAANIDIDSARTDLSQVIPFFAIWHEQ